MQQFEPSIFSVIIIGIDNNADTSDATLSSEPFPADQGRCNVRGYFSDDMVLTQHTIMNCENCNSETNNKHYCCKKCYLQHRASKNDRLCQNCGKKFHLKNTAYEKRGGGKYCSKWCGTRKLKFNEKYFDIIDTEQKAYWLGFLFADGSQNGQAFQMALKIDDKHHLEKFKIALEAEQIVKEVKNENHKKKIAALLQISSQYFCKSLEKIGCVKNKTLIVKYPIIPDHLHKHFIRGVFDGDGTVGFYDRKHNYLGWSIYSASKDFCYEIYKIIKLKNIKVNFRKRIYKDGRYPGYNVAIGSQKAIKDIYHYLYDDATVFLERKKEKFNLIISL